MKNFKLLTHPYTASISINTSGCFQKTIGKWCSFLFVALTLMLSGFASATAFEVRLNLDTVPAVPLTLRQALLDLAADPTAGPHTITFFNTSLPQTITLVDNLPAITKQVSFLAPFNPVTINGAVNLSTLVLGANGAVTIGPNIIVSGTQNENAGALSLATPLALNIENYSQLTSGTLSIGFSANCLHDTLVAAGTVALGGSLKISQGACKPLLNSIFTIISSGKKDPIQGTFAGLADGSEIAVGEYKYIINYKGSDVTLTVSSVPGTQTITFPSIGPTRFIGDKATLSATASSGLPVTYLIETPAVCEISGTAVTFGPINAGVCKITASQLGGNVNGIQYAAASPVTQSIVVNGVPAMSMVPANGGVLDFGGQAINDVATKTIVVKNSGTAELTVTAAKILPVNSDYKVTGNTCSVIPPPQTCLISITFKPTAAGALTAQLDVTPNLGTTQSLQLTGIGISIAQTISFPAIASPQTVGSPAIPLGATASSGLAVSYTVTGGCTESNGLLALTTVPATCVVTADQAGNAIYASATAAAGTQLTQTIVIKGVPRISLAPPISFGNQFVGVAANKVIKLNNPGTGPLTISKIAVDLPVGDFSQTSTCPIFSATSSATLGAGASCDITVTFKPTAVGTQTTALTVVSDAVLGPPSTQASVPLSGTGELNAQTITFGPLPAKTYLAAPFPILGTTASSGLPVTYSVITTPTSPTLGVCNVTPSGTVTILTAGICSIAADQAGNGGYSPAPRVIQDLSIAKAIQTIGFVALADRAYSPTAFDITATPGASNNAVTFTSTTPTICTVAAGTTLNTAKVTMVTVGSCSIKADEAFSDNFAAATLTRSFVISAVTQTIAFGALGNKIFGDLPFALPVATGGASGNPITFTALPATVCTVSVNTVTIVGAGDCIIAADQAGTGNNNYLAAPQVPQKFTVAKAPQLINFVVANQDFTSAPIPISANGGKSGNPVVFTSTTPSICTVSSTASGTTVSLLTIGTCKIQATQDGNPNYLAASSDASFVLGTASQSITFADIPSKSFDDLPFALVASGGASGNPVTFTSTPITVCTVSGNKVTIVGTGPSCTITANQAGDSVKYNPAAPVSRIFTVTSAKQVIIFNALASKTFGDAPFDISATGGASKNAVTFASTTPTVCTVAGNIVSVAGAGRCTIEAAQAGNANYAVAAIVPQTFAVAKAAQSITFVDLPAKTYGDAPIALVATSSTGLAVNFSSPTPATCEIAQNILTITATGTCTVRASQSGNDNYEKAADVERSFNVTSTSAINFSPLTKQPKVGEPVILSVSVKSAGTTPPTGTVTFFDNGTQIGLPVNLVNGTASFSTTALTNGNHKITATYSGDANNKVGTSDVFGVTVLVETTVTGGGGSSGSTGGGGGCAVNPLTDSSNGVDPSLPMLLFAAMLYLNRKSMKRIIGLMLMLSSFTSLQAMAIEPGMYFGAGGGKSNTEGDNIDFAERMRREGYPNVVTTLKFDDLAWKLFGGYQLNPYFAMEAAYVNLGKATGTARDAVANQSAFADAVARVQPRLAKGVALSAVGSMPVNPKFFAYAKLGIYRWNAEVGASTGGLNTLRTSNGNGAVASIGGEAELTPGWAARGEVERYIIKPDPANVFSFSLVYRY